MSDRFLPEWNLERRGGEYVYYEGVFSRGIRVTGQEAQVYLTGDEGAWSDIVHGREATEPPRPYWPSLGRRIMSLPYRIHPLMASTGTIMIANYFRTGSTSAATIGLGFGFAFVAFGVAGLWLSHRGAR